ncbi:LysR family transcriptional regulator [Halioxenophilus sp. WMMB6]|uniref:LysR family transcriptional regulator n=1 Tax=Halioxenophilus sp. WMMB6 TaxID=3073815 RepID=UPI00295F4AB2|nr:LysR family transcriptional regulator [Halioxenophilus sp. WMMB6]
MDLSLSKLQQLITVARTGSFSKAAVELNISQPALSRSVAAIEDRYGFQIFNRVGHGVLLTAAGKQVVAQAQPLLQKLRLFDNTLRLFGTGATGTLSIGFAPLLASQTLAKFAADYFLGRSQVQLRAAVRPGESLVEALKNDEIELLFVPESFIEPDPELAMEPLGEIQPACVVRAGHPLTKLATPSLDDLEQYPWASSVAPPFLAELPNPTLFECDNYHILRETVVNSDLVCICSLTFVEQALANGELTVIQVAGLPLPPLKIFFARLVGRISSPLAVDAIARMRGLLAN